MAAALSTVFVQQGPVKLSRIPVSLTLDLCSLLDIINSARRTLEQMATDPEPETLNPEKWMSKGDAARARGVSRQAIWELVNRGRLTTCRFKGRVYVSRAEVLGFAPRPRGLHESGYVRVKTVRPKKKKLDPAKWIYIVEAARETGLPRLAIVDLIRRGRIKKIVNAGKTFVSRAGLQDFMRQKSTPSKKK
jgi:hypothetical protein